MANGICDVQNCKGQTDMGWRPLSEKIGRQVCEYHWCRHEDSSDNFSLFDAFGFPKLLVASNSQRTNSRLALRQCTCGAELLKGCRYCPKCAKELERRRKRDYRRKKKAKEIEALKPDISEDMPKCKICGQDRKSGHSYCTKCAKRQKKKSNRERQRRNRKKKRFYDSLKEIERNVFR